jgi:hypothetical protein
MAQKIIFKCEDNHVPDEIFRLARVKDVFIKDEKTNELIQIIDLREAEIEE